MGLDTTHGAWNGAYSAFNTWRTEVAKRVGITLKEMQGFDGSKEWDTEHPLYPLLYHSDCDGELTPSECKKIADALTKIIDKTEDVQFGGHVGSFNDKTKTFIDGCLLAHSLNETIEFH
jgi:hypothetical protein